MNVIENGNRRNCHHKMRPGLYMGQTIRNGHRRGVTFFPGGPGVMRPCLKCIHCGYSVTDGHLSARIALKVV